MISPQKRRATWAVLSLWSLFALAMPQLLWACPMMGEIASASPQSCPCSAGTEDADHGAHSCCDQVPLPSSETTGENGNGIAVLTSHSKASVADVAAYTASTLAIAPALESTEPTLRAVTLTSPTSPSLLAQHQSTVHSGRAPPL